MEVLELNDFLSQTWTTTRVGVVVDEIARSDSDMVVGYNA